ncbi:uncharacterized protein LOC106670122 [Cimex lectularius]|uniref:Uncharacterized protein n=1 Tax=Cimex lectularius TaxID=79782 RepID=A0A8I6TJI2_CIMLE|nr:uncharacterized protein LOC106670122 [Cimex lectularius]
MVNTDDAVFVVFCGPITAEEMEVRRKLGLFKNPDRDIDDNLDFDWFQESSANLKGHNLTEGTIGRRKRTSKNSPLRSAKSNLNSSYQQNLFSSPSSIYSPSDATFSDISIQNQTETCQPNTSIQKNRSRSFLSCQDSSPHIVNKSTNVDISKSGLNTKTNKRKRSSFSSIPDEPRRKTLRSIHSSLLILDKNQLSRITKSNKNLNCSMLNKSRKTFSRVQNTHGSSHMDTISARSLLQQTSNSMNQLPLKSHSSLQLGEDSDLTNNSRNINDSSVVSNLYFNFNPEETKGKECTCISLNSSLFNSQTKNLSRINRTDSFDQSLSPRDRHETELPRLDTLEKSVDDPKAKLPQKRSHSSLSHLTPAEKKVTQANKTLNDSLLKSFHFAKGGKKPIKRLRSSEPLRKTSVKKNGTFKIISPKKLSSSVLSSNKDQVPRTSRANKTMSDSLLRSSHIKTGVKQSIKNVKTLVPVRRTSVKKNDSLKKISHKKLSSSVLLANKNHVSRISRANKTMSDSLLSSQIQAAGSSIVKQPIKNLKSIKPLSRTSVKKKGSLKKISPKKLSSSVLSSNKDQVSRTSRANKTMSDSLLCGSQNKTADSRTVKQPIKNLKSLEPLKRMSVKKNDSLKKISPKKLSSSVLSSDKNQVSRTSRANKTMSDSLLRCSQIKTAGSNIVKQPIKNLKSLVPLIKTSDKKKASLKKISPKKLSSSILSSNKNLVSKTSHANKTMSNSLLCGSHTGSSIKQPRKNSKSLVPLRRTSVKKNASLLRKSSRNSQNTSGSSSPVKPSKSKTSVNKNNSLFLKSPISPSALANDSISLMKEKNSPSISMSTIKNPNSSMFSPRETFHSFKNETNGSMSIEKMNKSCSTVTDFSLCCGDSFFDNSSSSTAGISKGVNQHSQKKSQLPNPTKNIDDLAKPRRKLLANKSLNELLESSGTKFKRTMRQNKTLNESILKQLMLKERKSRVEQNSLNSVIADESLVKNKTKDAFLRNFNLPLKKQKGMYESLQDSLISLASSKSYTFTPDRDDRSCRKSTEASMEADKSMKADWSQEIDKNKHITPNTSTLHSFLPDKENFIKSTNSHPFIDNKKPKTPKRSTSNEERYSLRSSNSYENDSAMTRQNSPSKTKNVLNKPKLVVSKVNSDLSWSKKLNRSKILKAQRPNYVYSPSRFIHKKQ